MPKVLKLNSPEAADKAYLEAKDILQKGGVIAYPTDTCYGLGADPGNIKALKKIYRLKKRPTAKPILVLVSKMEQVASFASEISLSHQKLMDHFWPGPLTLLFKALDKLPAELTANSGKIGIRLPASPCAQQLLQTIDHPLTATSANLSGNPESIQAYEVLSQFDDELDLVLDGGTSNSAMPSTLVDPSSEPVELIREGSITKNEISEILNYPE